MMKRNLDDILTTLYHSYNGADGGHLALQDAKAEVKALMLDIIKKNSSSWDAMTNLQDIREAVEKL